VPRAVVQPSFIHCGSKFHRDHAEYAAGANTSAWKIIATA
jgi:hypothetical protein